MRNKTILVSLIVVSIVLSSLSAIVASFGNSNLTDTTVESLVIDQVRKKQSQMKNGGIVNIQNKNYEYQQIYELI